MLFALLAFAELIGEKVDGHASNKLRTWRKKIY